MENLLASFVKWKKGTYSYTLYESNYENIMCKKMARQRKDTRMPTVVMCRWLAAFPTPPFFLSLLVKLNIRGNKMVSEILFVNHAYS